MSNFFLLEYTRTETIHLFTYKRVSLWVLHSTPLPKRKHHPLILTRQMSYRNLRMTHRVNTDCRSPVADTEPNGCLSPLWVKTGDYEKSWRCVKRTLNNCPAFCDPHSDTSHAERGWNRQHTHTLFPIVSSQVEFIRRVRTVSNHRVKLESTENY